uniref:Uncharacterized protein n=1 Tax=Setaria digitata TaxID=48799 RepID=A0A915PS10_9BILA
MEFFSSFYSKLVLFNGRKKSCGLDESIYETDDIKERQKQYHDTISSGNREQLESNAPNNLILELQQRIGGSNENALALLEQLKKCLVGGAVSSNIHLNPQVIGKNA